MVFIQGSYDIPTTIGLITQALIATDDFEMVDEAALDNHNHAGICIKHIPTSQYLTLIAGYIGFGTYNNQYPCNEAGIRVIFSDSYDVDTHTYTAANKIYRGGLPIYQGYTIDPSLLTAPNTFSTSLWVDKYGFVGTIQNTYSSLGLFFALEFFPQAWVEYDDAEPITAVLYSKRSSDNWTTTNGSYGVNIWYPSTHVDVGFMHMRPYKYGSQTYASTTNHEGAYVEREAYRSEANNKVYFKFPTYENGAAAERKPYAESRRWFRVSVTGGLQIGDILNWIDPDEVTVHKYIVCVAKGDSMYYAIPYENAFDYAVSAKQ